LKSRCDFSKSTVIHAGEMLWELTVENSVCHFLKEMHADVKFFVLTIKFPIQFCFDILVYVLSRP
jgi:hypothetical protein